MAKHLSTQSTVEPDKEISYIEWLKYINQNVKK